MSDDYVDAAKYARSAIANYNFVMTREQEVAMWRQGYLEQKMRADSVTRAWFVTVVIFLLSNITWAVVCWRRG